MVCFAIPLRPDPLPKNAAQLTRIILSLNEENADLSEAEKRQQRYERELLEKLGGPGDRALFLNALDRLIKWG